MVAEPRKAGIGHDGGDGDQRLGPSETPGVLVVGEAITAFMHYPGDGELFFHGPLPSGAPAIFASAAARLGLRVDLAASVGDDVFGRQLYDRLVGHGVSTSLLSVDRSRPTATTFVTYHEDGSRDFVFHVEATAAQSVEPGLLDRLAARPDWLHVSGSAMAFGGATAETAWRAVERAREWGTPVSLDPNVRKEVLQGGDFRSRFQELLECASVVFASRGELEALGVSDSSVTGRGSVLVRKNGASGAVVTTSSGSTTVPAPSVPEVDPDGAGDIFAAGYVAATLLGHPPEAAARAGCVVAAESVQVRGPMESDVGHVSTYLGR
jgi:sugar/nucleoside kinase (ribokinase family)